MARRQVVEVQCDRCSRIEHAPENQLARKITIEVTGQGPVVFEDLCTPCWKTVNNHLEQACKKIEGVSPERKSVTPGGSKVIPMTPCDEPRFPDERQLTDD